MFIHLSMLMQTTKSSLRDITARSVVPRGKSKGMKCQSWFRRAFFFVISLSLYCFNHTMNHIQFHQSTKSLSVNIHLHHHRLKSVDKIYDRKSLHHQK